MSFWFWVTLFLLPSLPVVDRYLGVWGMVVYVAVGVGALWLLGGRWGRWARRGLPLRAAGVALAAVLAVGYPLANGGLLGGGSDRDDALIVAARALARLEYPYDQLTYLGNPITPLPGAVLLAFPFAALGLVVIQNWIWPLLFLARAPRLLGSRRRAALAWLALIFLSPLALNELVAGGDMLVNSLYLWLGCGWLLARLGEEHRPVWPAADRPVWPAADRPVWPIALLLGLFFSSRFNFWVLGPVLLAAMARRAGWGRALRTGLLVGAGTALVTLPFYLAAPARFSPLHALGELGALDAVWPGASLLVGLVTVGVTGVVALGVWRGRLDWRAAGAAALATPVLLATVLGALLGVDGWLGYLRFGLVYLPWVAVGMWDGGGVVWATSRR